MITKKSYYVYSRERDYDNCLASGLKTLKDVMRAIDACHEDYYRLGFDVEYVVSTYEDEDFYPGAPDSIETIKVYEANPNKKGIIARIVKTWGKGE